MKRNKTQARWKGGAQTEDAGRYPAGAGLSVEGASASLMRTKAQPKQVDLMEAVLERGNLMKAYERVIRNKGASGVDGIGVSEFKEHLKRHWPTIRARLLAREYYSRAGTSGGHTQAAGRGEDTRHSNADGSDDPAGVASGVESYV